MRKLKLSPQTPTEGDEQETLIDWANAMANRHPELCLLYAIPNGVPLRGPQRFAVINSLKKRGLKVGIPDLCLPVARSVYHGLYIEMKRIRNGVTSREQDWWLARLAEQGYVARVCEGFREAAETITEYLLLK